ncbi:MAG: SLBB domain-containing protein [Bdellovibrionaceae bacterium]|nr:SLBB domain-containing protein [Pseudobdellovibrionaceae bacterium]
MFKLTTRFITLIAFVASASPAWGKDAFVSSFDMMQSEAYSRYASGNEYISGQEPGIVMMKVNLWGAVRRPGIHHIPVKTNLIELMSFAGGPTDTALIDSITIKRNLGVEQKRINIDLSEIIHDQKHYDLVLKPDDIVLVPASQPWISQNMFLLTMVVSVVASTILSVKLIDER